MSASRQQWLTKNCQPNFSNDSARQTKLQGPKKKKKEAGTQKFCPALIKLAAVLNCELGLVQTSTNFQPPNFGRLVSAQP